MVTFPGCHAGMPWLCGITTRAPKINGPAVHPGRETEMNSRGWWPNAFLRLGGIGKSLF